MTHLRRDAMHRALAAGAVDCRDRALYGKPQESEGLCRLLVLGQRLFTSAPKEKGSHVRSPK